MKRRKSTASKKAAACKKPRKAGAAGLADKISGDFASQVAGFIKRYRPALEALAKR